MYRNTAEPCGSRFFFFAEVLQVTIPGMDRLCNQQLCALYCWTVLLGLKFVGVVNTTGVID